MLAIAPAPIPLPACLTSGTFGSPPPAGAFVLAELSAAAPCFLNLSICFSLTPPCLRYNAIACSLVIERDEIIADNSALVNRFLEDNDSNSASVNTCPFFSVSITAAVLTSSLYLASIFATFKRYLLCKVDSLSKRSFSFHNLASSAFLSFSSRLSRTFRCPRPSPNSVFTTPWNRPVFFPYPASS